MKSILNKINEISKLQDNWDGYNAAKPHPLIISKVQLLLYELYLHLYNFDADDITPTPNGTIHVDCYSCDIKYSIEIGLEYSAYYIEEKGTIIKTVEKIHFNDLLNEFK